MNASIKMTRPEENALQPLREVGTEDKSQFWDMEDVMQALRVANRRGIPLRDLFGHPKGSIGGQMLKVG
jgi:hypothetical protein